MYRKREEKRIGREKEEKRESVERKDKRRHYLRTENLSSLTNVKH